MKDKIMNTGNPINDLLEKVKRLEKDYVGEASNSKLDGQKKKNKMRNIRKEIARAKTKINENIYEKVSNE